jgi:hypothetical protein
MLPLIRKKKQGKRYFYFIDPASPEPSENERTLSRVQESLAIGKIDNLLLLLLTLFFSLLSLVNIILGARALMVSTIVLIFVLLIPFYVGYIKGAIWDNTHHRIIGWNLLFAEAIVLGIYVPVSVMFHLQLLVPIITLPFPESLGPLASLGLLLVSFLLVVILDRPAMIRVAQLYFDSAPSRRAELIETCTWGLGNPIEHVVPSMIAKRDLEYHWIFKGHVFRVEQGLIECRNLVSGFFLGPLYIPRPSRSWVPLILVSMLAFAIVWSFIG